MTNALFKVTPLLLIVEGWQGPRWILWSVQVIARAKSHPRIPSPSPFFPTSQLFPQLTVVSNSLASFDLLFCLILLSNQNLAVSLDPGSEGLDKPCSSAEAHYGTST
jgi:hypothetical protein